ncbi:unnamed protein product, partial [Mesorhabditis belari]|uniref:ABC-type xenobiotic transporter n=1 Tax=Mesorhabditis belari TaxID=2138241 RepID=A0AAF3EJY2_9BILA
MGGKKSDEEGAPLLGARKGSFYGSENSLGSFREHLTSKHSTYGIFHFATGFDYLLFGVGAASAFIHGAGFPLLSIVLGGMTTVFLQAQNSEFVTGVGKTDPNGVPGITQEAFDAQVIVYCYYYLALGFLMFIACMESFSERLVHQLRQHYLKAILRQQIAWFDEQSTGNLTARLTDDLERVREGLGDKLSLFIQMAAAFASGFIVGFMYSWQMTLVMLAFAPFVVASGAWMSKVAASRTQMEQETYAVAGGIAEETFSSIRTVHSLNGHKRQMKRFEDALEVGRKTGLVKYFYMGLCVGFSNICMYGSYALAFWYGSRIIIGDPTFDRGTIFTVFFSVMSGSTALGGALPHLGSIATAVGAARSVLKVLNTTPYIDPYSTEGVVLNDLKGSIQVQNVHFRYPSRKDIPILRGVSLLVEPGQQIALVGASGCGKSTIINLLLRYYDPNRGKITLDGVDLKDLNVKALREQIGIVSQEPILFDGTLYENIRMGNENATQEEVMNACKQANATEFIKRLPDGLATRVGERGVQLSGGQKQRIAIARALVKNPKLLLLDEATSALDTESEQEVQHALDKAMHGRTTIIVAHRLSTIRNCDRIFVFKEGKIAEHGTHEELIEAHGIFHEMTQQQKLKAQEAMQMTADLEDRETVDVMSAVGSVRSRKSSAVRKMTYQGTASMVSRSISTIKEMQDDAEEARVKPTPVSKIFVTNRENWGYFALGLLGSTASGCVTPVFALVYAQIFNVFSEPPEQMEKDALFWCVMFLILGFVHASGFFLSANTLGRCGEGLTKKLRMMAFTNLMRQDVGFYDDLKHGTGKLCTRFATDAPNVRYVFTRLPVVISSVVTIGGAIVVGLMFGWKLAIVLIFIVPLIILSGYFEMKMQFGKKMRDTELLEEAGKVAGEAVEHIRTVQALNRQEKFHFLYCEYLREPYKENMCQAHTYGGVFAFSQSIIFFMYALAFWLGARFVDDGSMQPTDVYRVFFAFAFCGQMVGNVSSFIPDIVKARLAASLLFYLIEHPTEIDNLSENGIKKVLEGNISLRNLHFNYPTRRNIRVLNGLNIEVKRGQTVALVGHSGCGKSTVMAILERFYNTSKGIVMVDGENIRNVHIRSLREQVCIVSQEPTLFDCSIAENITYGLDRQVTYDNIVEAAKMANIHSFILGLPQGYDTRVGERGTQLSGGQKQRIAIARALVRNPAILLLDEATSALDTQSERVVQEALETASHGRTCLVIAHRLSTVQNSDLIAVVHEGRIVETGTHEQLLRSNDIYKKLCATQQLVEAD